jgi:hypothetical protein
LKEARQNISIKKPNLLIKHDTPSLGIPDTSKLNQMYPDTDMSGYIPDVSRCIRIYPDVSRMYLNTSRCIPDISRYIPDVSGYIWMYLYPDTSGFIWIYPGFQGWVIVNNFYYPSIALILTD